MSTPLPRAEFAVTEHFVYLNHASAGVLPRSSRAAIDAFLQEQAESGVAGTFPHDCRMPEYRDLIGSFIGAGGTQVAILSNTGAAASIIALGLSWNVGDEILLCADEFPANVVPWLALSARGVNVRLLESSHERLTPDRLQRELPSRTRLVAVSWISYADGYRHDLAELAEIAHARGALLCVDAMQGLGAFPIDVRQTGVDALYSGAAKWMLALHGVAILYLAPNLRDSLQIAAPGWRSMYDMWDFHNYTQPFTSDAMRFEGGTPNLLGTLSVTASIDLLVRSNPAAIETHILSLTDRLCEELARLGAQVLTERGNGVSSGIVTFTLPGYDSLEIGRALEQEGIMVTSRPNGVRVSPHGYNTAAEIEVFVEALAAIARARIQV